MLPATSADQAVRRAVRHPPGWLLATLAGMLFCSGISALIYEVLWLRMLGWVFGVTTYAASAVWASFMAGLAIGSLVAGNIADRAQRPLGWFGAAELLVGLSALGTPLALRALQHEYVALYPSLPHVLWALTLARFSMSFLALIVPATMMGASLPLAVRSSEFRAGRLGERLGVLYGSNTAGAIIGTLGAGLFLIPALGIQRTFHVAAALNFLVGSSALLLSWAVGSNGPVDEARPGARPRLVATTPMRGDTHRAVALVAVLAVFALSGAVALALEVVWFRVLTLFLRPTVYGFAVMLAAVLSGIAAGSYIITPCLDRHRRPIAVLASLQLALGLAVLLSFRSLAALPALSDRLTPILSRVMPEYLVFPLSGSLLAIFPAALLMGLAFPLGLRTWATGAGGAAGTTRAAGAADGAESGVVATRVGQFYSMNVTGAIAGSILAGFVLLPHLGSRTTLGLAAAASFGSGLVLLAVSEWRRTGQIALGVAATAVFVMATTRSPDPFDEFVAQRYPSERLVWREEGVESTVVVHESPSGDRSLTVNGNHQASTDPVTSYVHRRIGHLPMALHRDPRTALVIGLGGGATAGAVSIHGPSVDIVELAGAVVRAARLFEAINYGVLARPNVRIQVDDGRNYLMLTPRRYDVITADVIHPIYAGSGNLYSLEYFELLRRVLNPDGMVVQWVAGTDAEYKLIARTFLSVFPETTAWADGSLLVGRIQPLQLRRADFEAKLRVPGKAQGLHDLNVETFDALLAAFRAGPDELRSFVGPGPLLTDDRPLVEYFLSLPRDRDVDTSALKGSAARYVVPD